MSEIKYIVAILDEKQGGILNGCVELHPFAIKTDVRDYCMVLASSTRGMQIEYNDIIKSFDGEGIEFTYTGEFFTLYNSPDDVVMISARVEIKECDGLTWCKEKDTTPYKRKYHIILGTIDKTYYDIMNDHMNEKLVQSIRLPEKGKTLIVHGEDFNPDRNSFILDRYEKTIREMK